VSYELVDVDVETIQPVTVPASASGLGLVFRQNDRIVGFALQDSSAGSVVAEEVIRRLLPDAKPPSGLAPTSPVPGVRSDVASRSLSVVVCTRNHPDLLTRCLRSIFTALERLSDVDYEVIVVDNAPSDESTRRAVDAVGGIRYIREPVAGLDIARNQALGAATGDIVAYTDDDAVVDRWWAVTLMEAWEEHPDAVVITGSVLPYELKTEAQVLFERRGGFTPGFQPARHENLPAARAWLDMCQCGAGCNMSMLRSEALRLHGFDDNLDTGPPLPGGGDLEFFYRAVIGGGELVYAPSVAVLHQHRQTIEQLRRQYRSWGTTWMTCVMHSRDHGPGFRRAAWSQVLSWYAMQLRVFRSSDAQGRMLVLNELLGALRGMMGEYRRSERRMAQRRRAASVGSE
jgi:glycosyltransferase involved in cell wall biosynthesis